MNNSSMQRLTVLLMTIGLLLAMALPAVAAPPSHANENSCPGTVVSSTAPVGERVSWLATNFPPGAVAALVDFYRNSCEG